jgi:hypothetical protein
MKNTLNEEEFLATLLFDEDKKDPPPTGQPRMIIDSIKQIGKKQLAPIPKTKLTETKDQVKNTKLVSVLKTKMFRGYSKVKKKAEAIVKPQLRPISALYVKGKRYNVRLKSTIDPLSDMARKDELNFLKIEKYVDDTYYLIKDELQNSKPTGNGEYKKLFLTADKFNSHHTSTGLYLTEQEEKERKNLKVLKQIFNNNPEEAKQYNSVSFLAFEVKKPKWNPLAGTNKAIIEKEILREVENINRNIQNQTSNNLVNNLGKTNKSATFLKSPNFEKDHNKKSYLSFYSNPGLHKFKGTRQAKSAGQVVINKNNINLNSSLNTEKQFFLSGTNFNKTHSESIKGLVPILSKNDSVIEYAAKSHSNFFTTNLRSSSENPKSNHGQPISGIFLKNTQKENYLKNFENIKIVEKLKRKDGNSISCIPIEFREEKDNYVVSSRPQSNLNQLSINKIIKENEINYSNIRPGTQSVTSKKENRLTTLFEDEILANTPRGKVEKTGPIANHHIKSLLDKKKKFKELRELAFSNNQISVDRIDSNYYRLSKDFKESKNVDHNKLSLTNPQTSQAKHTTISNKIRDYKVAKELSKIYDKNDVNSKLYGKKDK